MKGKLLITFIICICSVNAQKFENLALTPPMGWNSWNTFACDIHEDMLKEMVDIIVNRGMKDAGYEYVVVDDCWEALSRDNNGNLIPDPEKFPSGMKTLGDYIHSKGLKFGIHNCAGNTTCNGYPGGRGYEYQDAKTYASWGVDYLKYDWCDHGSANSKETYKTMSDALFAAGRPIVFSLCEWGDTKPWLWAKDIGHLWRTTGDITDCFDCQETYSLGWETILRMQEGLEKYAGPDHWNDPDMLEVGNEGLTYEESKAHFSMWCMLASPLMAGNDLRTMTPEILDILTNKEVIAINQDPLGKQGYRYMNHPGKQIYIKELEDGDFAVCFFNNSDREVPLKINWEHFNFILNGNDFQVRNLWKKEDLGNTKNNHFNDVILVHGVILLRLSKI
ncbi:glycoside hydrolase family 27 protein [Bacteroidota bacterium]